jgi:hypothetical protein
MFNRDEIEEKILQSIEASSSPKRARKKKKYRDKIDENDVQTSIITWLKKNYPEVLFKCDGTTGMKMSIGMAMKQKRLGGIVKDFPDFSLYKKSGNYAALFLELKRPGIQIYKEDGTYYKNEHHINQSSTLQKLITEGYASSFGIGFEHSTKLITAYLQGDWELFEKEKIV